jgi:hypothetical protein
MSDLLQLPHQAVTVYGAIFSQPGWVQNFSTQNFAQICYVKLS